MHLFLRYLTQVILETYPQRLMLTLFSFLFYIDAVADQCLSPSTLLNKSASDLLSLAHLSSSQTPLSSSISTVNPQTLPTVTQVKSHFLFISSLSNISSSSLRTVLRIHRYSSKNLFQQLPQLFDKQHPRTFNLSIQLLIRLFVQ